MGDVLAWLEAAQAEAARTQRNHAALRVRPRRPASSDLRPITGTRRAS